MPIRAAELNADRAKGLSVERRTFLVAAAGAATPGLGQWAHATPLDLSRCLGAAVRQARLGLALGEGPFGAVVAHHGEVVAGACHRIRQCGDPTAHAVALALRAIYQRSPFNLADCALFATVELCPWSLQVAQWAGIREVWHALTLAEAAAAGWPTTPAPTSPLPQSELVIRHLPFAEASELLRRQGSAGRRGGQVRSGIAPSGKRKRVGGDEKSGNR